MEVSTSPASEDLHPDGDLTLPTFQWLDAKGKLVVSERALRWLREGQLAWCEIEEVWPEDGRV